MHLSPSRFTQIDWLLTALRWLLLFSVLGIVLLSSPSGQGPLANQSGVLFLLLIAAGYNLLTMLLAIGLMAVSGGGASLLFYFSLFPILSAALRLNWLVNLLTALGIGLAYVSMDGAWPNIMILAVTSIVGGALGGRIRKLALDVKRGEEESELHRLRSTREQARAIFEMASTHSRCRVGRQHSWPQRNRAGLHALGQSRLVVVESWLNRCGVAASHRPR
jgi:hypothetical protein